MCHGSKELPKYYFTAIVKGYVLADSEADADDLVKLGLDNLKGFSTVEETEINFDDVLNR